MNRDVTDARVKVHRPNVRFVACGECPRETPSFNLMGPTKVLSYQRVPLDDKAQEWIGPIGVCTQVWREGKCPVCGTVHVSPAAVQSRMYDDGEFAMKEGNGFMAAALSPPTAGEGGSK